jgi:hypothetical protein
MLHEPLGSFVRKAGFYVRKSGALYFARHGFVYSGNGAKLLRRLGLLGLLGLLSLGGTELHRNYNFSPRPPLHKERGGRSVGHICYLNIIPITKITKITVQTKNSMIQKERAF